mmetsp:Transcript_5720/g.8428  ORF Transcript_5720/g.8428 Transcript_5720/m.8428 type:complete len:220 (+) Transcript_5720:85-744(+)
MAIEHASIYENDGDSWFKIGQYPKKLQNTRIEKIVTTILGKMPKADTLKTITEDSHHYHIQVSGDIAYACVTDASFPMRISHKLLKEVIKDFEKNEPKNIGKFLKKYVKEYSDLSNDKLNQVNEKANKIHKDMQNTIDAALTRGDDIELLDTEGEELYEHSRQTFNRSRKIKRQLYIKMIVIISILVLLLLSCVGVAALVIFLLLCVVPSTRVGCFGES